MLIWGACFAARVIVGLNYILEFIDPEFSESFMFFYNIHEPICLILLTAYYQFYDRNWKLLFNTLFIVFTISTLLFFYLLDESAKLLYSWE
jgi:hypothetical protein